MALAQKEKSLQDLQIDPKKMGSTQAQVVVLTYRIQAIADHLSLNKKDHSASRALQCLLSKRRALLKYCSRKDSVMYRSVLKVLGLRR